jgi:hypothetical protein
LIFYKINLKILLLKKKYFDKNKKYFSLKNLFYANYLNRVKNVSLGKKMRLKGNIHFLWLMYLELKKKFD